MSENSDEASKSDWVIRDALPEDEPCLVSMWLKSYAHSREVREAGFSEANVDGSSDEIAYWRVHQPIVTSLLASGRVRVACQPGRATYEADRPAVIAGWVCTSPGFVHWVGVKRSVAKLSGGDVARDMVGELLGIFDSSQDRATFDLLDAKKLGMLPDLKRDRTWLGALRVISARTLERDEMFTGIVDRVMAAKSWTPSSERAA